MNEPNNATQSKMCTWRVEMGAALALRIGDAVQHALAAPRMLIALAGTRDESIVS